MKQECVVLHTEKTPDEAEQILHDQGLEIVFKSPSVQLSFKDLTPDEKKAWNEYQKEELMVTLKRLESIIIDFEENHVKFIQLRDEITYLRNNYEHLNLKSLSKLIGESISKMVDSQQRSLSYLEEDMFYPTRLSRRRRQRGTEQINCSCIVGRVENNWVRYLEFHSNHDPIVTITGSDITNLKSALEEKF